MWLGPRTKLVSEGSEDGHPRTQAADGRGSSADQCFDLRILVRVALVLALRAQ